MVYKKKVTQIGILVSDIEKATKEWEKFTGIKSEIFTIERYEVTGATYMGKPCYGLIKQALFNLSNVQIELISPYGDEPSVWKDCLDQNGEGLHHLAFVTDNVDDAIKEFEVSEMPLMQIGHWPAEPKDGTYAYMDARNSLKTIIELLCM
jgi:methylmalonyl-CoA/ethylmalonyl-CoA epimerase